MKKKLTKLKNQRKLYNPLKLVINQINFNYKLNIIFFKLNNISSYLDLYNLKYKLYKHKIYNYSLETLLYFILNKPLISLKHNITNYTNFNFRNTNKKLNNSIKLYQNNNYLNYFYNKINFKNELIKYKNTLYTYINNLYYLNNTFSNKLFLIPNKINNLNYTILGYKIQGSGRLGFSSKSTRKSKTIYLRGKTTLSNLDTFIDYSQDISIIRNGVYGIKIFKFYKTYQKNIPSKLKLYY